MLPTPPSTLADVLGQARSFGFLGPGPLEPQIRHAEGFGRVARRLLLENPGEPPSAESEGVLGPGVGAGPGYEAPQLVDLGSGGGLPGLVIAESWPEIRLVLVEAQARRAAFLSRAVAALGLSERVSVRQTRAEEFGRDPAARAGFDLVLARSFGPPAVVAECAAPFLRVGGWLVVSEPPEQGDVEAALRWPAQPLRQLGLAPADRVRDEFEYRALRQVAPCPERFPRRNGVPAKRPLF